MCHSSRGKAFTYSKKGMTAYQQKTKHDIQVDNISTELISLLTYFLIDWENLCSTGEILHTRALEHHPKHCYRPVTNMLESTRSKQLHRFVSDNGASNMHANTFTAMIRACFGHMVGAGVSAAFGLIIQHLKGLPY